MNLTKRNYFTRKANREYMSVSQFKAFDICPAAALAEINKEYEREETTALLVGSYVDAYFEKSLRSFIKQHPAIFKKDGTLKAEYVQANAIIDRIERDPLFMEYMSGKKQVIMEGEIAGVKVKIKVDSLHPDKIVDMKIMRDFNAIYVDEMGWLSWYEAWKYDLQGAVYQEIVRQNTGEQLPFYLAAATKEKVPDIDILHIGQKSLDYQLEYVAGKVKRFDAMKKGIIALERCEKCDYCKETKILAEPTETDDLFLY